MKITGIRLREVTGTIEHPDGPFREERLIRQVDDPLVKAIAAAAKELDDTRRRWLDPPDATEAELKKRTLTNLYNQRPTWLQTLHATLDRAV